MVINLPNKISNQNSGSSFDKCGNYYYSPSYEHIQYRQVYRNARGPTMETMQATSGPMIKKMLSTMGPTMETMQVIIWGTMQVITMETIKAIT